MSEKEQPQTKTYRGNCHCGAFIYEATVPEITKLYSCNCSLCTKKGYLWTRVPDEAGFKIVKGDEDALRTYQFGSKTRFHKFCPTCGSALFSRIPSASSGQTLHLNARCIQDLDIWSLPVDKINGAAYSVSYKAPRFEGPEPTTDADPSEVYHGSCHCGAVTMAVKTHPLDKYPGRIVECSCSICQRNGYIWIYPKCEEVVIQGKENLVRYTMGQKMMYKTFCTICGVPVGNHPNDLSEEEIAALGPQSRKFFDQSFAFSPINIRMFNGSDIDSIKPTRFDGFNLIEPKYINP